MNHHLGSRRDYSSDSASLRLVGLCVVLPQTRRGVRSERPSLGSFRRSRRAHTETHTQVHTETHSCMYTFTRAHTDIRTCAQRHTRVCTRDPGVGKLRNRHFAGHPGVAESHNSPSPRRHETPRLHGVGVTTRVHRVGVPPYHPGVAIRIGIGGGDWYVLHSHPTRRGVTCRRSDRGDGEGESRMPADRVPSGLGESSNLRRVGGKG